MVLTRLGLVVVLAWNSSYRCNGPYCNFVLPVFENAVASPTFFSKWPIKVVRRGFMVLPVARSQRRAIF